jgi:hypothetical protein
MPVVLTRTARSAATDSLTGASIVALVGSIFAAILLFADDLPTFAKVVMAGAVILCLLWMISLVRRAIAFLRAGRDWRVEITDRKLSWQSPLQDVQKSFGVPFSNIKTLRHVRTKTGSKGTRYTDRYTIELKKGGDIKLSKNVSGVNPEDVFQAMHEKGVPFVQEVIRTKAQHRQKREEKRARRREARAQRSPRGGAVVSGR